MSGQQLLISYGGSKTPQNMGITLTGNVTGHASCFDDNGNLYITGRATGSNDIDGFVVKITQYGTLAWKRQFYVTISGTVYASERVESLSVYGDFLYVGAVLQDITTANSAAAYLLKLNTSDGSVVWSRRMISSVAGTASSATISSDSSGILFASVFDDITLLAKYDHSGALVWNSNGVVNRRYDYITPMSNGNYLLSGARLSSSKGFYLSYYSHSVLSAAGTTFSNTRNSQSSLGDTTSTAVAAYGVLYTAGVDATLGGIRVNCLTATGALSWSKSTTGWINTRLAGNSTSLFALTTASLDNDDKSCLLHNLNSDGTVSWSRIIGTTGGTDILRAVGVVISDDGKKVAVSLNNTTKSTSFTLVVPSDGSDTGTYGSYTYATTPTATLSAYSNSDTTDNPVFNTVTPTLTSTTPTNEVATLGVSVI